MPTNGNSAQVWGCSLCTSMAAAPGAPASLPAAVVFFLWISVKRSLRPRMKWSLANCHRSGSDFLKPCCHERPLLSCFLLSLFCAVAQPSRNAGGWCRKGLQAEAHIGVELPHKGGEVVVLEVLWQQLLGAL